MNRRRELSLGFRTSQEQNRNKTRSRCARSTARPDIRIFRYSREPLRPGSLAVGIVGPIAIGTDHAPLDTPAGTDHAAVLDDGIANSPPLAVRGLSAAGAEPARDRAVSPGPIGNLASL